MLLKIKACCIGIILSFPPFILLAQQVNYPPANKVAADFKKLLERPRVSLNPSFQIIKTDSVIIEHGFIYSEVNERVPILIYKPVTGAKSYPTVIFLHGTGGKKEDNKGVLYQLVKRGIIGVSIDARFHGERIAGGAHGSKEYVAAATAAWENKDKTHQTHPFLFDTAFDLWRVTDYLVSRPDVDAARIGMGGISMGGIETWLSASVDKRIKVIVLDISVQSFKWSLDNDKWQARAGTIQRTHLQAAKDMGDSSLNKRNVKAVWDKLLPGITGEFDCPSMLRLMAPRALLIVGTENDPNCPLPGADIAYTSAMNIYTSKNAADKIKRDVTPKLFHTSTPEHLKMTLDWFSKWL
ncbi:Acetyl xylan esterase (AXE1) [Mucilaginibacter pineti]|uniref:Acetyl xylan esterase (AXE1) n=1 Tax=Mucilaginibacter pineti TaxID=1391627 RepID=A0A1G7FJK9_9SPHI|nr:alpha/beta hydrolase [Mucilaginibacter pineti]SDE76067.1 Acetyl xylan esterase (AXE1) [Mucilaginibacter pineti]